eukprot:TRINITY_DN3532_c0_g1_i3.p1 TRINITY_DN3532_c0_g1~~TRINITY_DN3532_c0_g1_i3.p1  ORF type:complete len:102 (+),score=6.29 TRINITY_DN3532_c0_g1_i3:296-601(+)
MDCTLHNPPLFQEEIVSSNHKGKHMRPYGTVISSVHLDPCCLGNFGYFGKFCHAPVEYADEATKCAVVRKFGLVWVQNRCDKINLHWELKKAIRFLGVDPR